MNNIIPLLDFLSGKKTYLIAIVAIFYIVGIKLKLWEADPTVIGGLATLAVAFLRAGIAKAGQEISEGEASRQQRPTDAAEARGGTYLPTATKEEIRETRDATRSLVPLLALGCIVVAIALGCSGCATRPVVTTGADGVSVTNLVKDPDIARISRLSGTAAQLGSLAWLTKNPGDRSYFAVANATLRGLIDAGNYDPAAFAQALQGLPIKELRGTDGALYISVAIVLWDEALQSAEGLNRQELVAATLKAVQSGIQRTLDATAPRSELMERLDAFLYSGISMPATSSFPLTPALSLGERGNYSQSTLHVLMPRWRPALLPAETWALVTFAN